MEAGHKYLSVRDAARWFGWSESKLRTLLAGGLGPPPIRIGARLYFTEALLRAWVGAEEQKALARTTHAQRTYPRLALSSSNAAR